MRIVIRRGSLYLPRAASRRLQLRRNAAEDLEEPRLPKGHGHLKMRRRHVLGPSPQLQQVAIDVHLVPRQQRLEIAVVDVFRALEMIQVQTWSHTNRGCGTENLILN